MPLEDEIEKLKKLNPAERIKRLMVLEEQKKKEIEEAEALMKEAVVEETERAEEDRQIPVPHMKAESPDTLETIEAKLLWAAKRGVSLPSKGTGAAPEEAPAPRELESAVEESRILNKGAEHKLLHYGEQVDEAIRKQSGAEAAEMYSTEKPGQEYMSNKQQEMYQKPEASAEFSYHARSATPGHERESQDFYRHSSDESHGKKKKSPY